jgi:hypothetical protein
VNAAVATGAGRVDALLAARVDVPSVPGTLEPAPVDRADQVESIVATATNISG